MSLKQEIETWVLALDAYDNQDFEESLRQFDQIADTSKILFNCGVIYATLGEHERAVDCYQRAVGLDRYLAIAYFQQGVSNFLLGDFEEALANFNDTLLYLRGNTSIDYEQLGLNFRLYSCEVLFNRGLCYVYLQQMTPGMQDLSFAAKEKVTSDHDVIDDAIRENADGYTVFSIPVGVLYRPNAAKVKNLKSKDYLGKARLVAASDRSQGADHQWRPMVIDKGALEDREGVSWAATNLVHKGLSSRSRQQSEPPLTRTLFPPTPPPDDRSTSNGSVAGSSHHRSASLRAGRPPRLDLERTGTSLDHRSPSQVIAPATEKPRIGTTRTASEPRGPAARSQPLRNIGESGRSGWPRGHRRNLSDAPQGSGDSINVGEQSSQNYADDYTYTSPATVSSSGWGRGRPHPPDFIDEADEYEHEESSMHHVQDMSFDFLGAPTGSGGSSSYSNSQQRRTRSPARHSHRANSRRPEVRRFRTKVHAPDDIRYIMIGPTVEFAEFEARIREKFGFRCALKLRVQDDGDMITMVDQEDLDLLLASAKEVARREGSEMGKMEVWVEELAMI
ncbi:hypothetical protein N7539_005080 [Penicillium diatomitis]|uniref:PB1 domain-containing protein n=1 Tax=Penicillium diatomitis TaxID=2819901 RepID=A0A9W9X6B8_9EURO|nr:uncharacterized protein N7539_005080 [Penicillium diatomitis]KAJ5485092.1 hypothetical protein N7539_005080 [Penicillium diatomitis]